MTIVYVHGGVAGVAKEKPIDMSRAVAMGVAEDDALDAAEAAVRVLEDDPILNAGYGSVLDKRGRLGLDAGLAVGSTGRWAGVGAVTVANPISLARVVLERTPHVLVAGDGADELAASHGLPALEASTPEQHARWERAHSAGVFDNGEFGRADHVDTVGAVALDDNSGIVAASSTGGVFGKIPGRIGDAPVFGAGIYADERVGVIGTGVGELFLETLACLRVAELVEKGTAVQPACEQVIRQIVEHALRSSGRGDAAPTAGLLALDSQGNVGTSFTGAMWPVAGPHGPLEPVHI